MPPPASAHKPGELNPHLLKSHLPSLDGMRAVSILFVLIAHGSVACGHETKFLNYLGQLGVSTFFVISGMLITWLMIRERDATGTFSLSNFYIRRFLRIIPVFWLLILTVTVLKMTHIVTIGWVDILRALTFTHNYPLSWQRSVYYAWWLSHTWSLSLEEQFYFVWPSLFFLLPRRVVPRLAAVLALSGPILRLVNYYFLPMLRGAENGGFQTRIDILMAGCASAFLLESPVWRERIRKIPTLPVLAATTAFLLVVDPLLSTGFPEHSRPAAIIKTIFPTLEGVAIAVTLLVVVAGKRGLAFQALNLRAATHFGQLSYSLYIWQQLFLVPGSITSVFSLLWRLVAAYLTAFCSFNFFEQPFLNLRKRFRRGVTV